jgi:Bacterial Ig-like domain (group 2)
VGFGAKHLNKGKIPAAKWVEALEGHQQMIRSIDRNEIYVLHNGKVLPNADPLDLPEIPPIAGAAAPRVIPIPEALIDPKTDEKVATGAEADRSRLVLRTSEVSMRWSLKARHTINGWTHDERSTGYWEVPSLTKVAYSERIYGDVFLDALAEYKQNDRRNHSDAPLTRALQQWITNQIEEYASEFVKLDKLQSTEEEKNDLSRLNEQLNDWKNKFLQEQFGGLGVTGTGGSGGTDKKPLPKGEVANVRLTASHAYAGRGVSFRPTVEFFDKTGKRVRPVPHVWSSSDWAVATVDDELNTVTTHKAGTVEITVTCKDSGVHSNVLAVEVLDISTIELSPLQLEVHAASRSLISAVCNVADGRTMEGVYLVWAEDDNSVAQVGASGMVFGFVPGTTAVTAGDSTVQADEAATVIVLDPKEKEGSGGGGFPRILLSEIDIDPLGEAPPVFSAAEPPVHQRPQDFDHNIWWINMGSPLARRYIDTARGGGAHSREWRVYLLERYIEVMVKIILTYSFMHGDDITFETMLRRWDEESVAMQERAFESLQAYLEGGDIEPPAMKAAA